MAGAAPATSLDGAARGARPGRTAGLPPAADHLVLAVVAVTISGLLLRLLARAHIVGTRLRKVRREHRELVDLLGDPG